MNAQFPKPLYHFFYKDNPNRILKVARKNLGITQKSIANLLGTTPTHISKLENEKAEIYAGFWFRFCELTHISTDVYSCGYNKRLHLNAAWVAIQEKRFNFQVSPKILLSIKRNELVERKTTEEFERIMFGGFYRKSTPIVSSSGSRR